MKNFIVTIGIEVHTVLNTKTKMFSRSLNSHNAEPNTLVSFMDLALPGILPIINKNAVKKAIILADALNMRINYKNIQFDRKNYFYPDLPKGFQITQQFYPIGKDGYVEILDQNNNTKKIYIERIHMEEDTAKQTIVNNMRLMDYNRAGDPLIEIVTTPCINSAYEAAQYLQALRRILIFKDISDAKMEEGSLRADINISVRLLNQKHYGTKVEIKNINSINNVIKAIEFEINRQCNNLLNNQEISQETRRFDDSTMTTIHMRYKTNAVDYRYMTDPNVLHFKLNKDQVNEILNNAPKNPNEVIEELTKNGFDKKQIDVLMDNYELYQIYNNLASDINDKKMVYNWTVVELNGILNKKNLSYQQFNEKYYNAFKQLLYFIDKQEINNKQAKILNEHIFDNNQLDVTKLIKDLGFEQIKDENILIPIIKKYINDNQELVKQYNERTERVEKFLVGMVMKETNSQANPNITMNLVRSEINKFLK